MMYEGGDTDHGLTAQKPANGQYLHCSYFFNSICGCDWSVSVSVLLVTNLYIVM